MFVGVFHVFLSTVCFQVSVITGAVYPHMTQYLFWIAGIEYAPVPGANCTKYSMRTAYSFHDNMPCPQGLQFNTFYCVCDYAYNTQCITEQLEAYREEYRQRLERSKEEN